MNAARWMWVALAVACSGGTAPGGGTGTNPSTTDPGNADPELSCDDQTDDDGDGLTDCDDPDCAADQECVWPATVGFETLIEFAGNGLAHAAGYDDCSVHVRSQLARDRGQSCPGCDRVLTGDFTYLDDDCPADFDRPTSGSYGVAFTSDAKWEIWGQLDGDWSSIGSAKDDGTGTLRIDDTQPLDANGVGVGDLTTHFAFTP